MRNLPVSSPAEAVTGGSASMRQDGMGFSAEGRNSFVKQRLHSLDAYRGLIMITLAFGGFGVAKTAALQLKNNPDSVFWTKVKYQFGHVDWVDCGYWDLIQPSFMFMVGVSMAYSYLRRKREGQSYARMLGHAVWRSFVLIALGIVLISNRGPTTNWSLTNVLTQIGLGYSFLFLLWGRTARTQRIAAALLLIGTWLIYVNWPATGIDLEKGNPQVGVPKPWATSHLAGISPAWHKNANAGHFIDVWLLNKFPRETPFKVNRGGYATINFLPSLATMLFGLMCGELLRSNRSHAKKLLILTIAGLGGLAVGYILSLTGVCPMVKRIWTPSWTLFSTGSCCLILATLYLVIDIMRLRPLAFPLIVVGMNSMAMYCMEMLLKPWVARTVTIHFGNDVFLMYGTLYEPMVQATIIGLFFWLVCLWLYRQNIFVRV